MIKIDNQRGVTLVELVVVITVIIILTFTFIYLGNPLYNRSKSRDNKRIGDIQLLERIITEYRLDHGTYPDTENILRTSNTLPTGRTSLTNPRSGWIVADLIEYNPKLPVDPLNNDTYCYSYVHNNDQFELSVQLEVLTDEMTNDAGNDENKYEVGTNKTLITP